MYRRNPLGVSNDDPPVDGIAPYTGATTPGPVGTSGEEDDFSVWQSPRGNVAAGLHEVISLPFAVGGDNYRLGRLDADWQQRADEEAIPPEQAAAIIERAIVEHRQDSSLVRLLQTVGSHLAGVDKNGVFVLVVQRPQANVEKATAAPPAPPPPTPRAARAPIPTPSPPPPVHWIEIQLLDEEEMPVANEEYVVTLTDGSKVRGVLNAEGCARLSVENPGACKVMFPRIDTSAWADA